MQIRRYLLLFHLPLVAFAGLYGGGLFLERSFREGMSPAEVVDYQTAQAIEENRYCLFLSGLHSQEFLYKLALYEKWKPDILVLGSSRVLQLRAAFFSKTMVNAGRAMPSLHGGYHFLARALEIAPPKLLIIGLDSWWFNAAAQEPRVPIEEPDWFNKNQSNPAMKLIFKIIRGEIGVESLALAELRCHVGVSAIRHNTGFDAYGSFWYTDLIVGDRSSADTGFGDTLDRIEQGHKRFQYGGAVAEAHLSNLRKIIDLAESAGVEVRLFLPPFAQPIAARFEEMRDNYGYFFELRRRLVEEFGALDFSDPAALRAEGCEFIDGFHGGPVVYARVLQKMAEQPGFPRNMLASDVIDRVALMTGQVSFDLQRVTDRRRIDFLQLGCPSPR
jgi:hypothetical protein